MTRPDGAIVNQRGGILKLVFYSFANPKFIHTMFEKLDALSIKELYVEEGLKGYYEILVPSTTNIVALQRTLREFSLGGKLLNILVTYPDPNSKAKEPDMITEPFSSWKNYGHDVARLVVDDY